VHVAAEACRLDVSEAQAQLTGLLPAGGAAE
jgi:hypothetical protein